MQTRSVLVLVLVAVALGACIDYVDFYRVGYTCGSGGDAVGSGGAGGTGASACRDGGP